MSKEGKYVRTFTQNLTTSPEAVAVSLSRGEDLVGLTIKVLTGTVSIRGRSTDAWVDIGSGVEMDIDFDMWKSGYVPQLKAAATGSVGLLATIYQTDF